MMGKNDNYTPDVRFVISCAREETHRLKHRSIGSEHLLLGMLKLREPLIEGLFASLHVSTANLIQALDFVMRHGNRVILSEPVLSVSARTILLWAEEEATQLSSPTVGIEHLVLALLKEQSGVTAGILESFGVNCDYARSQLFLLMGSSPERVMLTTEYHIRYESTPALNQVSHDLTLAALEDRLDPLIGRQEELERTMQILSRRTKNNPMLIGPAGVGKTAIAEGLAQRIIQGRVPDNLLHTRVVALDVGLLSCGIKFRGDFEERLKRILREVATMSDIIIVIDELHTLVQTDGAEGSLAATDLFKPMLARGEFQCIGSTTLDLYRKTIESDPALERRFQPVLVAETTTEDTIYILRGLRPRYEAFHHVVISDGALQAAVEFSTRYITHRHQPDKALDLLDETASRVNVQRTTVPENIRQLREELNRERREKEYAIVCRNFPLAANIFKCERRVQRELWNAEQAWLAECSQQRPVVGIQDVTQVVAMWTGIPIVQMTDNEISRVLQLESELQKRVIGQHEAVCAVASAVRRSCARVRDLRRPIASFIFVGPTGVGKTELARTLTASLFGSVGAMLELDMSEFMESHSSSRLVGAPPGYVGYQRAGQLTEFVHRHPYSVILFDEIEKAHPRVFDLFLQVLEDGYLTDARGQRVDFRHTILIFTSNIGTLHNVSGPMAFTCWKNTNIQEKRVLEHKHRSDQTLQALREVFRPDLLNRLDDIVIFHPLEPEQLRTIVDIFLEHTQQKLALQQIALQITESARLFLLGQGYQEEYGARPLRHAVQLLLEDRIAEAMLKGIIAQGSTVIASAEDEVLTITIEASSPSGSVLTGSDGDGHVAA
jgi:ATP-dependent Clp protease ATP-binding subunit ClpC